MSVHGEIDHVADHLRSLASRLRQDPGDPDKAARELTSLADDLEDLARKVKHLARKLP